MNTGLLAFHSKGSAGTINGKIQTESVNAISGAQGGGKKGEQA